MSPIRIIIIVILLYIGYLLIKGGRRVGRNKDKQSEIKGPSDASDVLVEDPVCKKLVPKGQAVTARFAGQDKYFCSEECRTAYKKEYKKEKE